MTRCASRWISRTPLERTCVAPCCAAAPEAPCAIRISSRCRGEPRWMAGWAAHGCMARGTGSSRPIAPPRRESAHAGRHARDGSVPSRDPPDNGSDDRAGDCAGFPRQRSDRSAENGAGNSDQSLAHERVHRVAFVRHDGRIGVGGRRCGARQLLEQCVRAGHRRRNERSVFVLWAPLSVSRFVLAYLHGFSKGTHAFNLHEGANRVPSGPERDGYPAPHDGAGRAHPVSRHLTVFVRRNPFFPCLRAFDSARRGGTTTPGWDRSTRRDHVPWIFSRPTPGHPTRWTG